MHLEISNDHIVCLKSGLGSGMSGNQIYTIFDKDRRPLFVIKVFKGCSGDFSREFFALKNFGRVINTPPVVEIEACVINNSPTFFLVMTYVEGSSFNSLLKDFLHEKAKSKREKLFKKLNHVYKKLGDSFGTIYSKTKTKALPIHSLYLPDLDIFNERVFSKLALFIDPTLMQNLKKYFSSHFALLHNSLLVRSYLHGDLNPENFLYNESEDRLWMLDFIDGSASIGKNGLAIGPSCVDVALMLRNIAHLKDYGFSNDECTTLYNAFPDHYTAAGGVIPSQEIMDLSSFFNLLEFLLWCHDTLPSQSTKDQEFLKKESRWATTELEKLVQKP